MSLNPNQFRFSPYRLEYGEEVEVDPDDLVRPYIRLNERDPRRGGSGAGGWRNQFMDEFIPGHGKELVGGPDHTMSQDDYIDALANSMRTHGQLEPGWLMDEPEAKYKRWGSDFWLGEGNHRLAAARRAGMPFRIVRKR